jgi:hypothetical protein
MRTKIPWAALAAACITLTAVAPSGARAADQEAGKKRTPPPEAFAACEGKKDGDRVSFTGARGETLSATCRMFDGKLAAAPDRNAGQQASEGGGPPRAGERSTPASSGGGSAPRGAGRTESGPAR